MAYVEVIGGIAAVCTTVAFIPQIVKIRRQGGKDLSYSMLSFYLTGVLLWLVYGLIYHAPSVIWANAAGATLVIVSIVMKAVCVPAQNGGPRRLRIAVDMDEVIVDFLPRHLRVYNERSGENLTADVIARLGVDASVPAIHRGLFEALFHEPGFFDDLEVMAGSQQALQRLSRDFDVFVTSAAMDVPSSFDAKFRWMRQHFPFIPSSNIVFCGDKGIVDADFLIDDNSRHFAGFRGTGILFTAPHNARETAAYRVSGWEAAVDTVYALAEKIHPGKQSSMASATRSMKSDAPCAAEGAAACQ